MLGGGGTSQDVLAQLNNLAGEQLRRGTFDIEEELERDRQARLALANQVSGTGTDVFRVLSSAPRAGLAGRLETPLNPQQGALVDFLGQILNVQQGEALSRAGGGFFERGGGDILGSVIGAVGDVGAAFAGRPEQRQEDDILSRLVRGLAA